jgi:hypothetical protein
LLARSDVSGPLRLGVSTVTTITAVAEIAMKRRWQFPEGRRVPAGLDRLLGAVPPASGAVVMGTGIVSIALSLDGRETLSRILLVLAAVSWVTLGVLLAGRAARDHARFARDVRTPGALAGAVAGGRRCGAAAGRSEEQ